MNRRPATAKLNLTLVVGPLLENGKHEVATVLQRLDLADRVRVEAAPRLRVTGFLPDTLVRRALQELAAEANVAPNWHATIAKRIPVAAGLGGGSSDAATALRLANELLDEPLPAEQLLPIAAGLGADCPFFLSSGPQLGTGDGSELAPLDLPQDYWVLLLHPRGAAKASTAAVYRAFDERDGAGGFDERRAALLAALGGLTRTAELAALPRNDLASSPFAERLLELGAFRADVTGAGPVVYGLFLHRRLAQAARALVEPFGRVWITVPAWYG